MAKLYRLFAKKRLLLKPELKTIILWNLQTYLQKPARTATKDKNGKLPETVTKRFIDY
jgi:hypothetical protein